MDKTIENEYNEEEVEETEEETEEETSNNSEESNEDVETLKNQIQTLQKENQTLQKNNKTLQAQKEHNRKKLSEKAKSTTDDAFSQEELVLIAQNQVDDEDLEQLKAVQKGYDLSSLKEAMEKPVYQAYKEKKNQEKERKDASLGASEGSGTESDEIKPDMSEEEHRKVWEKYQK